MLKVTNVCEYLSWNLATCKRDCCDGVKAFQIDTGGSHGIYMAISFDTNVF